MNGSNGHRKLKKRGMPGRRVPSFEHLEARRLLAARDWTGVTSPNWSTASNWDPSVIPTNSDLVSIESFTNAPGLTEDSHAQEVRFAAPSGAELDLGGKTLNVGQDTAMRGLMVGYSASETVTNFAAGIKDTTSIPGEVLTNQIALGAPTNASLTIKSGVNVFVSASVLIGHHGTSSPLKNNH